VEGEVNTFEVFDDVDGETFAALVGRADPSLLDALRAGIPDRSQRVSVMRILSDAFMTHLEPDWEPDPEGAAIDALLGRFLKAWPIEDGSPGEIGATAPETT
jgi:hypothetical protein